MGQISTPTRATTVRYADPTGFQTQGDDDKADPKPDAKATPKDAAADKRGDEPASAEDAEAARQKLELSENLYYLYGEKWSIWSEDAKKYTLSPPNLIYASATQSLGFAPDDPVNDFLDLEVNFGILAGALSGKGDPGTVASAGKTLPDFGLSTLQLSARWKERLFGKDVILGIGTNVQSTSASGLDSSGYTTQITVVPTLNVPLLKKGDFGLAIMTGVPMGFLEGASHGGVIGATPTLVAGYEPDNGPVSVDVNAAGSVANTGSYTQGPTLDKPASIGTQASVAWDVTGTKRHILLAEGYYYHEGAFGSPGSANKYGGGLGYTFSYRDDKVTKRQTSSLGVNLNFYRETGTVGTGNTRSSFTSDWLGLTFTAGFRQW